MTYFNEFDPFAAQWLRNLYPTATVDEKDIRDVQPADIAGFRRCHFFGGVGGWEYALELAGWPLDREVWTGSCPCQPLSCAGKRKGEKDERHLWPEFYRLISECRPATIFGEQVASPDGVEWLDGISLDLEELGYAVAASDLPAAGSGAPHPRQRIWWVGQLGNSNATRRNRRTRCERSQQSMPSAGIAVSRLANSDAERFASTPCGRQHLQELNAEPCGAACGMGDAEVGSLGTYDRQSHASDGWSVEAGGSIVHRCIDGNGRRISVEPSAFPLAARIPRDLGQRFPELRPLAKGARANRVGRLRGYGNAIVPQVAATFIRAFMEATA